MQMMQLVWRPPRSSKVLSSLEMAQGNGNPQKEAELIHRQLAYE